ncbi:hypothetical protein DSO57_1037312 [Entomophthora muscae]|uniref:Uncharacterized protein n=1 Tax=Entomophthora muscae TaxID=34485 RepID=A0ACC2RPZ6_9FUNG|nr:hypothetical protein DSO57_1037312 [Entomophthora muscae]
MNQTPDDESELYRPEYVAHNLSIIDFNRSCLSMVSGTASGILGLTGYQGFVFYFACSLLMTAIIYLVKILPSKKNLSHLFISPKSTFFFHGVLGGLMSHVLFWTLFYGIVHIYI